MPTWNDIREDGDLRAEHNLRGVRSLAIQSQYSASRRLLAMTGSFQDVLDPTVDIDLFYKRIFNILTAEGYGLDNWGRILGIARVISDEGVSLTLEDEMYRLLLLYKAMANISDATAAGLNRLLGVLIATGVGGLPARAYVLEIAPMVIRWVFEDFMSPIQLAVFNAAGTLARGAGVGWEFYAISPGKVFGFDGQLMLTFNLAPFAPDDAWKAARI
jgi:hypothetical protein